MLCNLHGKETEDRVQLLLPFFRVKTIGDALIKQFPEWPFQHTENEKLEIWNKNNLENQVANQVESKLYIQHSIFIV